MMLFSGFLIALNSIFKWLAWIQWISAFRYASNILTINEFRNIVFCQNNSTSICPLRGLDVLNTIDIDHITDWDLWKNYFALFMMTIVFLILAYIQLRRIKKVK